MLDFMLILWISWSVVYKSLFFIKNFKFKQTGFCKLEMIFWVLLTGNLGATEWISNAPKLFYY